MKSKRLIAASLVFTMLCGSAIISTSAANAVETNAVQSSAFSFEADKALYAHAVLNSEDTEAWLAWQAEHDEDFNEPNSNVKYFFLPSSADSEKVDIHNAYSKAVVVNGVEIPSGETRTVPYKVDVEYTVNAEGKTYTLEFMKSTAESAVYVNNSDADGKGRELMDYLNENKSNSASATGAIANADGTITDAPVKKIKGRGNTTWDKPKKAYNITFEDAVNVGTMEDCKKFSILANYQDDSLSRNRFLYDLSDAVDMPYASDSRYVDFYANGYYWGSYQMTEKVDTGKTNLLNDIDDEAYLNEDGTINEEFPFVCEVDASANDEDYYFKSSSGNKITIKVPELEKGDAGYDEVKTHVKNKFDAMYNAIKSNSSTLESYIDIDSVTKLYLINELGKNWDSGVSSTFFTYKQDEDGNWKFYGSPVWDYDNSLGNAKGLKDNLAAFGVSDYEEYSGWWCKYKDRYLGSRSSKNIMNNISRNKKILAAAPEIWFEEFVPAIDTFMSEGVTEGEMYSSDVYYNNLKGSAEMNYQSGWLLKTGKTWIADHDSLKKAAFDMATGEYKVDTKVTKYENNFDGAYNYCADWFTSRAAWMSNEMYEDYDPVVRVENDINNDGKFDVSDVTTLQLYLAGNITLDEESQDVANADKDSKVDVADVTRLQMLLAGYTF